MSRAPNARDALGEVLQAALDAVDAQSATKRALDSLAIEPERAGQADAGFRVVALGKAAAGMAKAAHTGLGVRMRAGVVVTKDGHARGHPLEAFEVLESGHPIPDARSEAAARRVLALAEDADPEETLLVLLSGGASALTSLPPDEVGAEALAETNRQLLACGADIRELNAVRKHLSQFSGGRLAQKARSRRIVVLAISDVAGDALDVIGSGPCAPDPTSFADALGIVRARGLRETLPESVIGYLEAGAAGRVPETPKPGDPCFEGVRHRVVARNADARRAAMARAGELGAEVVDLGECLAGEAREQGRSLAARAREWIQTQPVCAVAGGETVVTLHGTGVGGRNQELALAAALELEGTRGVTLLAVGSDGSDGPTDAAGAFADGATARRARAAGADPTLALVRNDSHAVFRTEGGLLNTGPTGTNVMDLVLIWAEGRSS